MNIQVRTVYGKTLTCYVNDRPVFSMPISRRQQFDARVKSLKTADHNMKLQYAKDWLLNYRMTWRSNVLQLVDPYPEQSVYAIEKIPTPRENLIAASIARLEGTIERNRRMDEKLIPWIEAGMPVPISSEPIFGGLANE